MRLRFLFLMGAAFVLAAGQASPSAALSLHVACITHNDPGDCAIGESQLRVDLWDTGEGNIAFAFHNEGPAASSITDVYWDDDDLFRFLDIAVTPGVDFSHGARPTNVPGAESISPRFRTTRGLSADSNSPTIPNGVNPGEMLLIRLALKTGVTWANVIQDLESGELRIAMHVQGYDSSGSESFVSGMPGMQPVPVPEPGTLALVSGGVAYLAAARRRA